jgi:hypothetical protein
MLPVLFDVDVAVEVSDEQRRCCHRDPVAQEPTEWGWGKGGTPAVERDFSRTTAWPHDSLPSRGSGATFRQAFHTTSRCARSHAQ